MEYINAKRILTTSGGEWFGSTETVNLYRGCSHGCIYCDSRSDCYAIKHFEVVTAKRNALAILEGELAHKRKKGIIALGAMSDSYNPHEKELELTRGALKLFDRYGFGVSIDTKSDLIVRDIDVLSSIAKHSPVIVKLTVTTPYDDLGRKLEPKVTMPSRRFAALEKLSKAGLYTGVLMTPILPFIEDDSASILSILDKAAAAGCKFAYAGKEFGVTMRDSQRNYFLEKIEKIMPGMKDKYCLKYGYDYMCVSEQNDELYKAFASKCNELGLKYKMNEIVADCKRPYETMQISLFNF